MIFRVYQVDFVQMLREMVSFKYNSKINNIEKIQLIELMD